jgi:signal transduction histidine kinase
MHQTAVRAIPKLLGTTRLRIILVGPFVLQIASAVGLVGYLSFRNGERSVSDLVTKLLHKSNDVVTQRLDRYLQTAQDINQLNADAIRLGELNLKDFTQAGRHFWKQSKVFDVSYIGGALPTGEFSGAGRWRKGQGTTIDERSARLGYRNYTYATDQQGNRTKAVYVYGYNPMAENWYPAAKKAGKPIWSSVFNWSETPEFVAIDAGYPVYDAKNQLIAILDVSLLLSKLSQFLRASIVSPSAKIFVMERDGALIASSATEPPFTLVKGKAERLSAFKSQEPLIQATAQALQQEFGTFNQIDKQQQLKFALKGGDLHFLQVTPWRDKFGLDWLVVVVVPESDFMAQINANTQSTILLCLGALLVATGVGILTARWITKPILKLNQAAKAIAAGNLNQSVTLNRKDELGELSKSFNIMALQLRTSFGELQALNTDLNENKQQLALYNRTLEEQVEERTQALYEAMTQLQLAQAEIIHSEKMAALGHLVAGIAHEINTPLGAIQASISNISSALEQSLKELPPLIKQLSPERLSDFFQLLDLARQPRPTFSSREERQLKRTLKQALLAQGLTDVDQIAVLLSQMGIQTQLDLIMPLLRDPDAPFILNTAYYLSSAQNNSQNIRLAVERASRIVYALKNFVRQDTTGTPHRSSVSEGINMVLTLYQNQIKHGIDIVKIYQDVPSIVCYPEELAQVWSNLISNAIQAMNYKGELKIEVFQQNQFVAVEISDHGCGVSESIKDKIFQPFFTTKPAGEGSGLGLSIARKIIEKHHGKITVESQVGLTIFRVTLPLDFQSFVES